MSKIIEVYAVHQGDSDMSSGKPKWFFEDEHQAKLIAADRGWYGGEAPISKRMCIITDTNDCYLIVGEDPIKLNDGPTDLDEKRTKILNRLSESEKRLLGLI